MKSSRPLSIVLGLVGAGAALLFPQTGAAQARSAAAAVLEEVVVTARRREESLEDLPLSVVAISGEAMQAQGIYRTNDIGDFAANVTLNTSDRKNHSRIFIRGIGGGFPNPIQVFGSGMYIDGHYLAGSVGNYMSTTDVERVEVLRGPQGTLFGKNTTGGAINIISAKPGPEFESYLTARLGDYGQQDLRGMINFPISDNVFARVSAASEQSDGYYYNRFLNNEIDYTDIQSFRGSLRFTPNENWTIDLTYQAGREDSGNQGAQCRTYPNQTAVDRINTLGTSGRQYTGPVYPDGEPLWGGGAGLVETAYPGAQLDFWAACDADRAMGDYVASNEKLVSTNADQDAFFVTANWDSGGAVGALENLGVTINASWRYNEDFYVLDRDKTNIAIDAIADAPYDSGKGQNFETTNFEILFNGDVSDRLRFTAGVFYYEEVSRTGQDQCWDVFQANFTAVTTDGGGDFPCSAVPGGLLFEFLPQAGTARGGPANAFQNVRVDTESLGVFGHLTYQINDRWDLAVGARYTEDDRSFHIVEFDVGATCFFIGSHICQPSPVLNYANVVDNGFFNQDSATFNEVTPTISLTRNLAGGDTIDSGMVYFTLSEGYLTGSFNDELNLFRTPQLAPLVAYGPEHVTNYEVGFKGTMNDGRLILNGDVFWMDYTDKHEAIDLDNNQGLYGPDPNIELTTNAGQVDIYGIELELRAQPWENAALTLDFGYLFNEYSEFLSYDLTSNSYVDLSDTNIGDQTPDWTLNVSLLHSFELANGATLTPQIGLFAQGGYEWLGSDRKLSDPKSYCYQDSYARFRARLTYVPPSGAWEAALYGYNIGDERYYTDCDQSRSAYDYTYGAPKWWGVEFTARWGNN